MVTCLDAQPVEAAPAVLGEKVTHTFLPSFLVTTLNIDHFLKQRFCPAS